MSDFTRSYDIRINAPVHAVFEYCRDPRHLFDGWPELEVTEVDVTPGGLGTRAHIEGRFLKGMLVEQIEREFTEVAPDEKIVSRAHAKVRFVGRTKQVPNGPVFTWLFEPEGAGTKLTFVVLEEDLSWWERVMESISAAAMGKKMHGMLDAIKAGAERRSAAAA